MVEQERLLRPEWELAFVKFRDHGVEFELIIHAIKHGNLRCVMRIPVIVDYEQGPDSSGYIELDEGQARVIAVQRAISLINKVFEEAQYISQNEEELARAAGIPKEALNYMRI